MAGDRDRNPGVDAAHHRDRRHRRPGRRWWPRDLHPERAPAPAAPQLLRGHVDRDPLHGAPRPPARLSLHLPAPHHDVARHPLNGGHPCPKH